MFGSSSAAKTVQIAGKTVTLPELATKVNRTAKLAEFERAVARIRPQTKKTVMTKEGGVTGAKPQASTVAMKNERGASSSAQVIKNQKKGRGSEIFVGKQLGEDARPQVSYLSGKEVKHGPTDSVRPDFVKGKTAIEVKNYDLNKNVSGLIRDVSKQAEKRVEHLPEGRKQKVVVDIRGQSVQSRAKEMLRNKVFEKTGGIIQPDDIKFLKK
jgi:hypothetical protein